MPHSEAPDDDRATDPTAIFSCSPSDTNTIWGTMSMFKDVAEYQTHQRRHLGSVNARRNTNMANLPSSGTRNRGSPLAPNVPGPTRGSTQRYRVTTVGRNLLKRRPPVPNVLVDSRSTCLTRPQPASPDAEATPRGSLPGQPGQRYEAREARPPTRVATGCSPLRRRRQGRCASRLPPSMLHLPRLVRSCREGRRLRAMTHGPMA